MKKKILFLVTLAALTFSAAIKCEAYDPRWVGRIETGLARSSETMAGDVYIYNSSTTADYSFAIQYGSVTKVINITTTGDLVVSGDTNISTGTISGYLIIEGYGVTQGTFTVDDNIYLSTAYVSGVTETDKLTVSNLAEFSTFTASGYGVIFGTFNVKGDANFENNVFIGNDSVDTTTFNSSFWLIPNGAFIGREGETVSLSIKENEVGINTDDPQFTLDVDGTQRTTGNAYFQSNSSTTENIYVGGNTELGNNTGDILTLVGKNMYIPSALNISTTSISAGAQSILYLNNQTLNVGINYDGVNNSKLYVSSGSVVFNSNGQGEYPNSMSNNSFFWYGLKSALRAGRGTTGIDERWADKNIGLYSTAFGYDCQSSGERSFSTGTNALAYMDNSIAIGNQITSSGTCSVGIGNNNTVTGNYAVAIGNTNEAGGNNSLALGGTYAVADSTCSVAIGQYVNAQSSNSWVLGKGVTSGTRLINSRRDSMVIGFSRTVPTMFISSYCVAIDPLDDEKMFETNGLNVSTINYVAQLNFADGTVQTSAADTTAIGIDTGTLRADITTLEISTGTLLDKTSAAATYLYKNEQAADSNLLGGYSYDYFVDTATIQNIDGEKVFSSTVTFSSANFSGRVGIGKTVPLTDLDVTGNIRNSGYLSVGGAPVVTGNGQLTIKGLLLRDIGSYVFTVSGSTIQIGDLGFNNGNVRIASHGRTAIFISSDTQNVCIGNSWAVEKLVVEGNIKTTGNILPNVANTQSVGTADLYFASVCAAGFLTYSYDDFTDEESVNTIKNLDLKDKSTHGGAYIKGGLKTKIRKVYKDFDVDKGTYTITEQQSVEEKYTVDEKDGTNIVQVQAMLIKTIQSLLKRIEYLENKISMWEK